MISVIGDDGQIICSTEQGGPAFAPAADVAHVRDIINHGKFEVGTFLGATPSRGPILPLCLPFTMTSGISGRVLYSDAITAPYAPAERNATRSPCATGGSDLARAKVSPVSQTGPTTS